MRMDYETFEVSCHVVFFNIQKILNLMLVLVLFGSSILELSYVTRYFFLLGKLMFQFLLLVSV